MFVLDIQYKLNIFTTELLRTRKQYCPTLDVIKMMKLK